MCAELSFGDQIGSGEFGSVYEIESLSRKSTPSNELYTLLLAEIPGDRECEEGENDEIREGDTSSASSQGPVAASLTLPIPNDLIVDEGNLDVYLRRRMESLQEQDDDGINPTILKKDIQPSNKPSTRNISTPRRRPALRLHDEKGHMINRQNNANNFEGYAIKVVRDDIATERKKHVAATDMATEAKMLLALSHPNIIRIQGIMGYIERPGKYGIIMNKLRSTLQEQIQTWVKVTSEDNVSRAAPEKKPFLENVPEWMLSNQCKEKKVQLFRQTEFFAERMEAVCDIAQAMKYLHEKKIVFRDLKTENVGLTHEGNKYVLFDFGLSRYLTDSIEDEEDQYHATGMTGSRLFMAPEVALCKPYGFSADVFSFAMLFWEVMSLKEVFPTMTMNKHFKLVIVKGQRPASMDHILPVELNEMMEDSWAVNPLKRPTFKSICETLAQKIEKYDISSSDRTFSMPFSFRSVHSSWRSQSSDAGDNDRYMSAEEFSKRDGYGDYDDSFTDENENSADEDSKMSLKSMRKHKFHSPRIESALVKVKESWDGKILRNLTSPLT